MALRSQDDTKGDLVTKLQNVFLQQIACDITFIVGQEKDEIPAHKLILIGQSKYFEKMFSGNWKDAERGNEISVPNIDVDTFTSMLRHMYELKITVNEANAVNLLDVAEFYHVETLIKEVQRFLLNDINPYKTFTAFEQGKKYKDETLKSQSWTHIHAQPRKHLRSEHFTDLSEDSVKEIVRSDELNVEESEIYNAALRWASAQCESKGLSTDDDKNIREALGEVLYLIRFPVMDRDFFCRQVSTRNILTADEKVEIFQSLGDVPVESRFNSEPRKGQRKTSVIQDDVARNLGATCSECGEYLVGAQNQTVLCKTCGKEVFGSKCNDCGKTIIGLDKTGMCYKCNETTSPLKEDSNGDYSNGD